MVDYGAMREAELIDSLLKNEGFKVLEKYIEKQIKEVRSELESKDSINKEYLAGMSAGLQKYKGLITRIVNSGQIASDRARQ